MAIHVPLFAVITMLFTCILGKTVRGLDEKGTAYE
jgi:hypothetical protein